MENDTFTASILDADVSPLGGDIIFSAGNVARLDNILSNRLLMLFQEHYDVANIEDLSGLLQTGEDVNYSINGAGYLTFLDIVDSDNPIDFAEWVDDFIPEEGDYEYEFEEKASGSLVVDYV